MAPSLAAGRTPCFEFTQARKCFLRLGLFDPGGHRRVQGFHFGVKRGRQGIFLVPCMFPMAFYRLTRSAGEGEMRREADQDCLHMAMKHSHLLFSAAIKECDYLPVLFGRDCSMCAVRIRLRYISVDQIKPTRLPTMPFVFDWSLMVA